MKKLLIVIAIVVALAAILFATPILGREGKRDMRFVGSAYAGEGGGGGF